MRNDKFKQLILELYKKWTDSEKTCKSFFGTMYNPISTHGFEDIKNIEEYTETFNPDMLLIIVISTNEEIEIYSNKLKDYKIDDDYITLDIGREIKFYIGN